jgi:dsDNA-specific endonuclease/ATPase MutS2
MADEDEPKSADESEAEVVLPIEDHIDLHAFRPAEVAEVVENYLECALAAGYGEVRIVHGRGIGVQREIVRAILARHPSVAAFHDAPAERGGWGATIVIFHASTH